MYFFSRYSVNIYRRRQVDIHIAVTGVSRLRPGQSGGGRRFVTVGTGPYLHSCSYTILRTYIRKQYSFKAHCIFVSYAVSINSYIRHIRYEGINYGPG